MENSVKIFVCATGGEGRCDAKGGGALFEAFQVEVERRGYAASTILRNACTRRHDEGPVVFIFPEDVWYTRVTPDDVPEIVERHLSLQPSTKTVHSSKQAPQS